MTQSGPSIKTLFAIVWHIIGAVAFDWFARAIWPDTTEWWQLGLFAIIFGVGAAIFAIKALRLAASEVVRVVRMRRFSKGARAPRADKLAGDKEIRDGGLL